MEQREINREKLRTLHLTYGWLIRELQSYGISTDKTEISSAFAGTRKGAKVDKIIRSTTKILAEYEDLFLKRTTNGQTNNNDGQERNDIYEQDNQSVYN